MAALRPLSEFTEVKRTSLNQGQGKKIQIVEYEFVLATSMAANDWVILNDLPGIDSVLAVLSIQPWDGTVAEVVSGYASWTHVFTRRAATGTTNAPVAGDDRLTFVNGHSGGQGWDGAFITILVEST